MNFRTISQLPSINSSDLHSNSVLEISQVLNEDEPRKYQSSKIEIGDFTNYIKDKAIDELSNNSDFGNNHKTMLEWLQRIVANLPSGNSNFEISGNNLTFKYFPEITGALSSFNSIDERIVNVDTMKNFMSVNSPMFISKDAKFSTSYFNVENNLMLDVNEPPSVNGEKHNNYLFRINGAKSNEWITTDSGIFTCYGWVDEAGEGEVDNARRWIALEAKIGEEEGDAAWKILQLQPFIHNLYCSYVGFTFPVDKGLHLRLRTGFKVGTNSNKYQSTQGSLTNHIANAFVGGIYRIQRMINSTSPNLRDAGGEIAELQYPTKLATVRDKVNEIIGKVNEILSQSQI